jgi:parallel beta-helix repeat protein
VLPLLCAAALAAPAAAHVTGVSLSGVGTAKIDGKIGFSEWEGANCLGFPVNLPEGGTTPGAVCAMNDQANLYLAVRFARTALDLGNTASFTFDNDNGGGQQPLAGDDVVLFTPGQGFRDEVSVTGPPCPPGGLCGLSDTDGGGTNDGSGAMANDGALTVYEFSHPLDTADDGHDFSLGPGDIVGFKVQIRIIGGGVIADTVYPQCKCLRFGDIVVRFTSAVQGAVVRVAPGGLREEPSCGGDWSEPCDLQYALQTIAPGGEIWARGGSYTPTGTTNRGSTFRLRSGVALYGGFAGTEEARDQRDPAANGTTLSGDIGLAGIMRDNVYHVVDGSGTDTAVLDGFVVSGGMADGPSSSRDQGGAGMLIEGGSPLIVNCPFSGNVALQRGGGLVSSLGGAPLIDRCTVAGNSAPSGGGMFNDLSNPTLANSTFSGNSAGRGGAIYNRQSGPALVNCTLAGNRASERGGGIYNDSGSGPELRNCILWGNGPDQLSEQRSVSIIATGIVEGGCPGGSSCTAVRDADPGLASLGGYGGAARTHLLRPGSPAIDAGDDAVCAGAPVSNASQNGLVRPQGDHCDLGAFEIGRLLARSSGEHDGWVLESTETSARGGGVDNTATTVRVGDDALNRQYRAFLSFDTAGLPEEARLTAATLGLHHEGTVGANAFGTHGRLLIDVRKGAFSENLELESADFQDWATLDAAGAIPRATHSRWHAVALGEKARSRIEPAGTTEFRVRFKRDDDNDRRADYLTFSSGDARPGVRPRLELLYYVP